MQAERLGKRLHFHFWMRKEGCEGNRNANDKRRSRHHSFAAQEKDAAKYFFGGAA